MTKEKAGKPVNDKPPPSDLLATLRHSKALKATELHVQSYMQPATRAQIMARISAMMAHQPARDPMAQADNATMRRRLWQDWIRALESFPPWAIDQAASAAVAEVEFFPPNPAQVARRAKVLVGGIQRQIIEARRFQARQDEAAEPRKPFDAEARRRSAADIMAGLPNAKEKRR